MATALSDIKRRIGSTAQIKKVTGTLQKVAAAKLVQDQRRLANADQYFARLGQLLEQARLALPPGADPHPLMTPPPPGRPTVLIIFGSDRGLCGSFNTLLMKRVPAFLQDHADAPVHLICRGRITFNRARRLGFNPVEAVEAAEGLGARMTRSFLRGDVGHVYVMYWHFTTRLHQDITVRQVLPAVMETGTGTGTRSSSSPRIEPSPQALIESLLPAFIERRIHNAFHMSAATENARRQTSMTRASENAGDMLDELRKLYSRQRQESITTEMLEIMAGQCR